MNITGEVLTESVTLEIWIAGSLNSDGIYALSTTSNDGSVPLATSWSGPVSALQTVSLYFSGSGSDVTGGRATLIINELNVSVVP